MRVRPLARLVVAALAGALALAWAAGVSPARAAAPGVQVTETGWWSRNPFADPPDGGFQVARAPDGDISTSAVRLAIEGRVTKATLVINEAGGVPEAAALRVCAATGTWSATNHAWSAAPQADCAKTAAMARNATGANWSADITALLQTSLPSVSVMIVPASSPAPAWQVDFSIAIVSAEAEPDPQPASSAGSGTSGGASGSGSVVSGGETGGGGSPTFSPSSGGFSFGPTTPAFTAAEPLGAEPSLDPAPQEQVTPEPVEEVALPVRSSGASQPWGRLIVFLPLSILAGAAGAISRRRLLERAAA